MSFGKGDLNIADIPSRDLHNRPAAPRDDSESDAIAPRIVVIAAWHLNSIVGGDADADDAASQHLVIWRTVLAISDRSHRI
jgi:hypothetical protein